MAALDGSDSYDEWQWPMIKIYIAEILVLVTVNDSSDTYAYGSNSYAHNKWCIWQWIYDRDVWQCSHCNVLMTKLYGNVSACQNRYDDSEVWSALWQWQRCTLCSYDNLIWRPVHASLLYLSAARLALWGLMWLMMKGICLILIVICISAEHWWIYNRRRRIDLWVFPLVGLCPGLQPKS